MSDKTTIFSLDNLKAFLNAFDVVTEKYRLHELTSKLEAETDLGRITQFLSLLAELSSQEGGYSVSPTYDKLSDIFEDLEQIYGPDEPNEDFVGIYDLTMKKLIGGFLSIPGLEQLFQSKYFQFEWRMHLNNNYDEHRQSYYRDHFIHQVKDAYMMYTFLTDLKLLDVVVKTLDDAGTPVSRYIEKNINLAIREVNNDAVHRANYREIFRLKKEFEGEVFLEDDQNHTECKKDTKRRLTERLLLSASVIAGLFHDIGYPLAFSMNSIEDMAGFMPVTHHFFNSTNGFTRINALLASSFLFSIVPASEIGSRYSKRDHGTLSALSLLLNYYDNGTIFHLGAIERAALELGALIIYDHTLLFNFDEAKVSDLTEERGLDEAIHVLDKIVKAKNNRYYSTSFYTTPLSYLFRLCDDLQEWGRVYFYLSKSHNIRICSKCKTPVVKVYMKDLEPDDELRQKRHSIYLCACVKEELKSYRSDLKDSIQKAISGTNAGVVKIDGATLYNATDLNYRKLFHINICDRVTVQRDNAGNAPEYFKINIDYDLFKLLQMCAIDPLFAQYRAKELREIRKRLADQSSMPNMIVNSFISNNPLLIKIQIMEAFLLRVSKGRVESHEYCDNSIVYSDYEVSFAEALVKKSETAEALSDNTRGQLIKEVHRFFFNFAMCIYQDEPTRRRIEYRIDFYSRLLVSSWVLRKNPEKLQIEKNFFGSYAESFYNMHANDRDNSYCGDSLRTLIDDCLYQNTLMQDFCTYIETNEALPKAYTKQFDVDMITQFKGMSKRVARAAMQSAISAYCSRKTYHPFSLSNGKDAVDFYYDLYFFQVLHNTAANQKRSS